MTLSIVDDQGRIFATNLDADAAVAVLMLLRGEGCECEIVGES